jgi:nicotinamide mononucleotide transporter
LNTLLEILAVLLGLGYLILAIRERRSCWLAGGFASLIFLWIFWQAKLPMQALLQLFYIAMAVHGWWHWGQDRGANRTRISRTDVREHAGFISLLAFLSFATLFFRHAYSDAQAILDTVSSWAGVLATWMVARKKLEAWLYWIVIDAATVGLYIDAGLLASSALYALYTVLAFVGWKQWWSSYRQQSADS